MGRLHLPNDDRVGGARSVASSAGPSPDPTDLRATRWQREQRDMPSAPGTTVPEHLHDASLGQPSPLYTGLRWPQRVGWLICAALSARLRAGK